MTARISNRLLIPISLLYFFGNDFVYLFNIPPTIFYISDYVIKTIIFFLILFSFKSPLKDFLSLFRGSVKGIKILLWSILLIVTGTFVDQILWNVFYSLLPKTSWSIIYPELNNISLFYFDLTYGLVIVAIVEEYIFRKLIPEQIQFLKSKTIIIFISALIFGFAHWSFGLHAIVTTSIWAILPIISVKRTNSLLPAVIAHFITNFIAFSGITNYLY